MNILTQFIQAAFGMMIDLAQQMIDLAQPGVAFSGVVIAFIAIAYYSQRYIRTAPPPMVIQNAHPVNDYYG